MKYTTLRRLQAFGMPKAFLEKLLTYLGKSNLDDEPVSLRTILDANGLDDAIRALSAIDDCPETRLFAVRCVRESAQPLLTDPRSLDALDVAELYAAGEASLEEVLAAWNGAWDVANAITKEDPFYKHFAAWAAKYAAWTATRTSPKEVVSIWATATSSTWAAANAANGVLVTARDSADAAWEVTYRAAREAQQQDFIDIFCS